jgi:putative membrane protein
MIHSRRSHRPIVALMAAMLSLGWAATVLAQAPPPAPPRLTPQDRSTIQRLHDGNQVQIQVGQLAKEKGASKASRDLGKQLIADHEAVELQLDIHMKKRGSDIKSLASTTSVDADHDLLATKSGTDFERAFGLQVVTDQQKLIDMLESARIETADDELRGIYDALLPVLRKHMTAARDIVAGSVRS